MPQPQKTPIEFVTSIESVRLTNFFIRTLWKTSAGITALAVRLPTSIILAVAARRQRHRATW